MYTAKDLIALLQASGMDLGINPMGRLHTLRKHGLIPSPERVYGHKHGSESMYPASTLDRLEEILRLQQQGLTMKQISRQLPSLPSRDAQRKRDRKTLVESTVMKLFFTRQFLFAYSEVAPFKQLVSTTRALSLVLDGITSIWLTRLGFTEETDLIEFMKKHFRFNEEEIRRGEITFKEMSERMDKYAIKYLEALLDGKRRESKEEK